MMKNLSIFFLSVSMAGFIFTEMSEKSVLKIPVSKPFESNFYADHVGPTPAKISHAFLLGLLYDMPPISR